jgi:hypothetical protein
MRFVRDGPRQAWRNRHFIVMVSVIERMAYLSTFLPSMTVMTLMTVICGCFLKAGVALHCPPVSAASG